MRRVFALVTALVSLFFVFYFVRLLVTHFLRWRGSLSRRAAI